MSRWALDEWERFEIRVKQERTLVRWAILTLVGACLFLIALKFALQSFPIVPSGSLPVIYLMDINWTHLGIVLVLSFLVMIVISMVLSYFLPQKRIISSLDMLLIGLFMTAILYLYLAPTKFLLVLLGMTLLIYLAGAADFIMRRVIGLSNMGTHRQTFEVFAPIGQLFAKFSIDVRDTFGLTRGRRLHGGRLVMYKNTNKKYRLLVVLAEHPIQPDRKSLVHFEAYKIGQYSIGTNADSERQFERDVDYFKKVLGKERPRFRIVRSKFDHTFPFRDEVRRILHEPAETKITTISQLPKRTILVAIGIPLLGLAYYFQSSSQAQNAWLTAIVGILLVLLPTLPYLRGPAERKWQTED